MRVKCVKCGKNGSLTTKTTISKGKRYRYFYVEHSHKGKKSWCYIGKTLPKEYTQTRYTNDTQTDTQTENRLKQSFPKIKSLGRDLNPRPPPYQAFAIDWQKFEKWLSLEYKPKTARNRINYAKKYAYCLLKGNLTDLRTMSHSKRTHTMKALSCLAKFLGIYEYWQKLIKNNGLKWSENTDNLIINRITKVKDSNEIFEWIKQVKAKRKELSNFMDFMTISGLRFNEAIESYNLIIKLAKKGKLSQYYNEQKETLEHFRFKEIFIRRTKKAFITFVPKELIKAISKSEPLTEDIVKCRVRKTLRLRFADIREAHGTFMTKYLRASEIDFLHGRVSSSVFLTNYFNVALINDLKQRVFKGIKEIMQKIK